MRVFQQTYDAIHSLPHGQLHPAPPDNYFLLAGYDWQSHAFKAWRLSFGKQERKFIYRPVIGTGATPFFFAGDDQSAVAFAIAETKRLLGERGKGTDEIDMEPFEVLGDIIEDPRFHSIGGAPQLGKVYEHLNTQLFQVLWPPLPGVSFLHVAGRPLLPDEQSVLPVYDPGIGFYRPETAG